jgi:hypothetical protein
MVAAYKQLARGLKDLRGQIASFRPPVHPKFVIRTVAKVYHLRGSVNLRLLPPTAVTQRQGRFGSFDR